MKEAFVDEALRTQPGQNAGRSVSRLSVATGLSRREVSRLMQRKPASRALRPSHASELFTRWMTDPRWCAEDGKPRVLRRSADDLEAPSFEALAHEVTQDVHPRSLLDELCRLGIARVDEAEDTVSLVRNAFVPNKAQEPMLGFLADNVGDHLAAATANVLATEEPPHFEQAVFADELSEQSVRGLRALVLGQWQHLMHEAVPLLEALIDDDRKHGRAQDRRVRIGLYSFTAEMSPPSNPMESDDESKHAA